MGLLRKLFIRSNSPEQAEERKNSTVEPMEQEAALNGCVVSDVGSVRTNNEDNYLLANCVNENAQTQLQVQAALSINGAWHIFGVFDGMGGGEKGEVASMVAAKIFQEAAKRLDKDADKTDVDTAMRQCFLNANNEIVDLQMKFKIYGTTGTVLCTNGTEYKIYHLGDSRAYLLQDGQMVMLTKDQTLAQMKIDVGLYDESDPLAEAERHKLTEYIGRDRTKENLRPLETEWAQLKFRDRFLLCSDGLCDMCEDAQIADILNAATTVEEAAVNLVETAVAQGGIDNVTSIVFSVE